MPQSPNVDGLPIWLQITVSLIFLVLTASAVFRGYAKPERRREESNMFAIQDMATLRNNSEVLRELRGELVELRHCIAEHIHHTRANTAVQAEVAQRLRELRERMDGKH